MDKYSIERYFRVLFMGFNLLMWIALWSNFLFNSTYLQSGYELPDDKYTVLVVTHRAASAAIYATGNWSYYGLFIFDFPSHIVTRIVFRLTFGNPYDVHQHLGTTVAGYELICWMIVSFVQWHFVAFGVGKLWERSRNRAPLLLECSRFSLTRSPKSDLN